MKKKLITIISALLAALFALGMLSGCDLIVTDNQKDMSQVVAEVNISDDAEAVGEGVSKLDENGLKSGVSEKLANIVTTDEIYKRDLVAYFLSYGYNMVSQGSSYADAFDSIMDMLVEQKVLSQFAAVYYLNAEKVVVDRDYVDFGDTDGYKETESDTDDGLEMKKAISLDGYLKAVQDAGAVEGATADDVAIAGLKYFLTDEEIAYTEYQVMLTINNTIDSYEEEIIAAQDEESTTSSDSKTTPTGANQTEASYPIKADGTLDYDVYTGVFNSVSDCGDYKKDKLEGSTTYTRKRAYIRFLSSLNNNYLLGEDEDVSDVQNLSYYKSELKTRLEQMLINKFSASVVLGMSEKFEKQSLDDDYTVMLNGQSDVKTSEFVTTMDSVSDSSFVLYSPANRTYGFVYNILLPFGTEASGALEELQSAYGETTAEYYAERQKLYENIQATDQRRAWFNGTEDYSFEVTEDVKADYYDNGTLGDKTYLFFKDSFVPQGEREPFGIDRYAGKYPFNGTVTERDDGTFAFKENKLKIDEFMTEMESYINYVVDGKADSGRASGAKTAADFYELTADDFKKSDGKIDYSKMIYYTGSVSGVGEVSAAEYMVKESVSYKALSAFNELMFAYSTDTGCFNKYYGYSIASKYEATDFVKEFEYAAQDAIGHGAGYYSVVGTDYGWHILYVSFVYNGGATYESGFVYADRNKEGTFSYYFYQAQKTAVAEDYRQSKIGVSIDQMLDNDKIVTVYEKRYEDLASIE